MFKDNKQFNNHFAKKEFSNQENFEAKQNLFGFFDLLLKIDKRINPHLYKNNEDNGNTNNSDKS